MYPQLSPAMVLDLMKKMVSKLTIMKILYRIFFKDIQNSHNFESCFSWVLIILLITGDMKLSGYQRHVTDKGGNQEDELN